MSTLKAASRRKFESAARRVGMEADRIKKKLLNQVEQLPNSLEAGQERMDRYRDSLTERTNKVRT